MYTVPNAGPPRHSRWWWAITWWAVLLSIGYLGRIALWLQDGSGSGRNPAPFGGSILFAAALLWAAARRARRAAAAEASDPPLPVPAGGDGLFWAVLLTASAWAAYLLLG